MPRPSPSRARTRDLGSRGDARRTRLGTAECEDQLKHSGKLFQEDDPAGWRESPILAEGAIALSVTLSGGALFAS